LKKIQLILPSLYTFAIKEVRNGPWPDETFLREEMETTESFFPETERLFFNYINRAAKQ
jgi:hypothetical protein